MTQVSVELRVYTSDSRSICNKDTCSQTEPFDLLEDLMQHTDLDLLPKLYMDQIELSSSQGQRKQGLQLP